MHCWKFLWCHRQMSTCCGGKSGEGKLAKHHPCSKTERMWTFAAGRENMITGGVGTSFTCMKVSERIVPTLTLRGDLVGRIGWIEGHYILTQVSAGTGEYHTYMCRRPSLDKENKDARYLLLQREVPTNCGLQLYQSIYDGARAPKNYIGCGKDGVPSLGIKVTSGQAFFSISFLIGVVNWGKFIFWYMELFQQ